MIQIGKCKCIKEGAFNNLREGSVPIICDKIYFYIRVDDVFYISETKVLTASAIVISNLEVANYFEIFPEEHTNLRETISEERLDALKRLGLITVPGEVTPRNYNVGNSNYSDYIIQPWAIMQEYDLNYWDGDIIKRVLRTKKGDSRKLDYEKIIHICQERLRQLDSES